MINQKLDLNITVDIGGLLIENPIMPASGAFGEGMDKLIDFNQLGAVVPKSITMYPQSGNVNPRACETKGGMINSIGIQSKGLDYYMSHTVPYYAQFDSPLIVSISAESIEEFVEMSQIIEASETVKALELNISCPNLKSNGEAFGMNREVTYELVSKVRSITEKPLLVKLTPNVTNIQEIAIAAEKGGADSLVVANTPLAMAIDIYSRKPKIGNVMGGLSGPAIKPIIVRQIFQVSEVVKIPIIGCGGVMDYQDAIEMILAGASAVQVGTASFVNPSAMIDIIEGIEKYMIDMNIQDINSLIGAVKIEQKINQDYI